MNNALRKTACVLNQNWQPFAVYLGRKPMLTQILFELRVDHENERLAVFPSRKAVPVFGLFAAPNQYTTSCRSCFTIR